MVSMIRPHMSRIVVVLLLAAASLVRIAVGPASTAGADAQPAGWLCTDPAPHGFADVAADSYYNVAVGWLLEARVTSGTSPGAFSPSQSGSRGQMAAFLWRAAGSPVPPTAHGFADVRSGVYYEGAVAWLVSEQITSGTAPGAFSPSDPVTRAQMAVFLWRASGSPAPSSPHGFLDVDPDAWYGDAVSWLVEKGVTTGTGPTTYAPRMSVTRGQMAVFLWRMGCGGLSQADASDISMDVAPKVNGTQQPGDTMTLDAGVWSSPLGEVETVGALFLCDLDRCERVTASQELVSYTASPMDAGKSIEGRVTARVGQRTADATTARIPLVDLSGAIQRECGYAGGEWTSEVVHEVSCDVVVLGSLRIQPGTVVRIRCDREIRVSGQLVVDGAILTRTDDPDFGQPAAGDNSCSDNPVGQTAWTAEATSASSAMTIDSSLIRGARFEDDWRTSEESVEVTRSTLIDSMVFLRSASLVLTSNQMNATKISVDRLSATSDVSRNSFRGMDKPLSVANSIPAVDLTKSQSGNRFQGTARERSVGITGGLAGKVEWSIPNLVIHTGTLAIHNGGHLLISNGATMKRGCINDARNLQVYGTLQVSHANLTYSGDDSLGGDTNGEGELCGFPSDHDDTWNIYMTGGELLVEDSIVRNARIDGSAERVSITGSQVTRTNIHNESDTLLLFGNEFTGSRVSTSLRGGSAISANTFQGIDEPVSLSGFIGALDLSDSAGANSFEGTEDERLVGVSGGIGGVVLDGSSGAILRVAPSYVPSGSSFVVQNQAVVRYDCGYGGTYRIQNSGRISITDSTLTATAEDVGEDGRCDDSPVILMRGEGASFSSLASNVDNLHFDAERYSGSDIELESSVVRHSEFQMDGGLATVSDNDLQDVLLSLDRVSAASSVDRNRFDNVGPPIGLSRTNANVVDLSRATGNRFSGSAIARKVSLAYVGIGDGEEWVFDGTTGAIVSLGTTMVGSGTASVSLYDGAIVAAPSGLAMFRLDTAGSLHIEGTSSRPVLLTSRYDRTFVGSIDGSDRDPDSYRFGSVLEHGPTHPALAALSSLLPGVEPLSAGPVIVDVQHAVVRYADEGFFQCSICTMNVNESDFYHVEEAAVAGYVWIPTLPCRPMNGSSLTASNISLGLGGVSFRTDMTGNYWGGPFGPSSRISVLDLVGLRDQSIATAADALASMDPESDDYTDLASFLNDYEYEPAYGGAVPNTSVAGLSIGIEWCTVASVGFPVPVDLFDYMSDIRPEPVNQLPVAGIWQ